MYACLKMGWNVEIGVIFLCVLFLGQDHLLPEAEEITMISIQLAARFLFTTGFHTKKVVRGSASDWYAHWILTPILRAFRLVL